MLNTCKHTTLTVYKDVGKQCMAPADPTGALLIETGFLFFYTTPTFTHASVKRKNIL